MVTCASKGYNPGCWRGAYAEISRQQGKPPCQIYIYYYWFYLHLIANWKYQTFCIHSLLGLLLLWWKTRTKAVWGGKFIQPMFLHHCSSSKKSRQELKHGLYLEAGANAEWGHGACCLLFYSLGHAQPAVLLKLGIPAQGCHQPRWDGLSFSNHKLRKYPVGMPAARSYEGISSIEAPTTLRSLDCVELTKTNKQKAYPAHSQNNNEWSRKLWFRRDNESLNTETY